MFEIAMRYDATKKTRISFQFLLNYIMSICMHHTKKIKKNIRITLQ
jgi:hypothetical protein